MVRGKMINISGNFNTRWGIEWSPYQWLIKFDRKHGQIEFIKRKAPKRFK